MWVLERRECHIYYKLHGSVINYIILFLLTSNSESSLRTALTFSTIWNNHLNNSSKITALPVNLWKPVKPFPINNLLNYPTSDAGFFSNLNLNLHFKITLIIQKWKVCQRDGRRLRITMEIKIYYGLKLYYLSNEMKFSTVSRKTTSLIYLKTQSKFNDPLYVLQSLLSVSYDTSCVPDIRRTREKWTVASRPRFSHCNPPNVSIGGTWRRCVAKRRNSRQRAALSVISKYRSWPGRW